MFSPDNARLATATEDGHVRIWEENSSQEKHRFKFDGSARLVRFSLDGKWLAATIYQEHETGIWQVQVWNVESGAQVTGPLLHQNRIYSLEFSPDSQRLVTATANNAARVWEIATGRELFQLRHASLVYSAAYSPGGRWILTASVDHTARIWDAVTGTPLFEPMVHDGRVNHAEFSPDGERVLTAGFEDKMLKVWDVRPRAARSKPLEHEGWVMSAEFDASGQHALTVTGSDVSTATRINQWGSNVLESISVWRVADSTRKLHAALSPGLEAVVAQFTATGPRALLKERTGPAVAMRAWLWDFTNALPSAQPIQPQSGITCVRFSEDGRKLAIGTVNGITMVWDVVGGFALSDRLKTQNTRIGVKS